jgi:hypothetical protein
MAAPSIVSFDPNDDQQSIVNKLNFNFEEISSADGGVQGPQGPTGATGEIGNIGPIGSTGLQGGRGTRWFVGALSPTGGYGDVVIEGDYWIDSTNSNKELYVFTASGWANTDFNLIPQSEFRYLNGLISATGATGGYRAIVQNTSFPEQNTLVISDGTPSVELTNPDYTNFLITTDPSVNDYPIMEFARGDDPAVGPSGYFKRPVFRWTGQNTDYDLSFAVPSDDLTILTGSGLTASASGDLEIQANDALMLQSGGAISFSSGSSSFFDSGGSLGITASNLILNPLSLSTDTHLSIRTVPGRIPSPDPVYGNVSLWSDNPLGPALHLGATGNPAGGNTLLSLQKDGAALSEIRTDGVIYLQKKTDYPKIPTFNTSNSITSTYGGGLTISWYYITSLNLGQSNTFVVDLNPANNLGIALDVRTSIGSNIMNLLERYQSMKIKVLTKTGATLKKINYLGFLTGAPPASNQFIALPGGVSEIDLEIFRGETTNLSSCLCIYTTPISSGRLF